MPTWIWPILAVALVALGFHLVTASRRDQIQFHRDFMAYMHRRNPQLRLSDEGETLNIKTMQGEGMTGAWRVLHRKFDEIPASGPNRRQKAFEMYALFIEEAVNGSKVDPADHRKHLLPRIVTSAFMNQAEKLNRPLPHRQFADTPLYIAYVVDRQESVMYVNDRLLGDLKMSEGELYLLALENLRVKFPRQTVRDALAQKNLAMFKAADTYDAARVLLVPEYLDDGEVVAAAIPDRDTLVLTRLDDKPAFWQSIRKLARIPAGDPLFEEPLRVTNRGISTVRE